MLVCRVRGYCNVLTGLDWYLNEKIVVVSICLNGRCWSAGCVDIGDKGDESLSLLAF